MFGKVTLKSPYNIICLYSVSDVHITPFSSQHFISILSENVIEGFLTFSGGIEMQNWLEMGQ